MMRRPRSRSGQALVLVAVALMALIGSAALVLLAGSAEWQKNELQALADSTALDAALKIGVGCDAAAALVVITEADSFLATQRTRTGSLAVAAGTCATPYHGTDTFAGGLSASYDYPYQAHQQQVKVLLTLNLPISFGGEVGATSTTVTRYAVGQALAASMPAVSAATLSCTGGQVNVAGDIFAQTAVSLSGGCALYAHQRFGAGAYSSFGNARVYTDGQSWTGAGGSCLAQMNTGSSNAICADGYELSGHTAPACGGATQYLSAPNLVVNANPCAAGVGRQPVMPLSGNLPPEPNTDPSAIATLQGTGGAACSAAAVYSNIVVSGVTVGTGQAPAPIKDAGGVYHFKPSCYGYLNPGALSGGISNRQVGAETAAVKGTSTPTLPAASQAGTLLVVDVNSADTNSPFTGPVGWVRAATAYTPSEGRSEIWYYANNPGGVINATFTTTASTDIVGQMTEWVGVATASPLDQTGTLSVSPGTLSATISTSGATTLPDELVITNDGYKISNGETFTHAAGWTGLVNDPANGFSSEYRLDLPAAVASETVTASKSTKWANAIATFKPAPSGAAQAAFDPGFYYFNGSGFAGGGGICLNGSRLYAQDVTLEFVNQAGFSSGTCAPGGGASCGGACQLGSTPCSITACPSNSPADPISGTGFTWFAAPCSQAPAGDSSCPGSAWCPAGDRSCWNLLIWTPAAGTGQLAIKGAAADAWLLGTIYWQGTCTDTVNGTSMVAGAISCGTLALQAAAGAGIAIGGEYGINTAVVEAVLIE